MRQCCVRALLTAVRCEKHALAANLAMHLELIEQASARTCRLIVFPEFSLTGSVDPTRFPQDAISIDDAAVAAVVAATGVYRITAVFGISECRDDEYFITQIVACNGAMLGFQRKRYLGDDEVGYSIGTETPVFNIDGSDFGIIICAEAGVGEAWDATVDAGAQTVLFCSAPGLYDRGISEASWRAGFAWWEECGLGDAIRSAERLNVEVLMSTQAGTTVDENFPGLAAHISQRGEVVDRLADWCEGMLIVELLNHST